MCMFERTMSAANHSPLLWRKSLIKLIPRRRRSPTEQPPLARPLDLLPLLCFIEVELPLPPSVLYLPCSPLYHSIWLHHRPPLWWFPQTWWTGHVHRWIIILVSKDTRGASHCWEQSSKQWLCCKAPSRRPQHFERAQYLIGPPAKW